MVNWVAKLGKIPDFRGLWLLDQLFVEIGYEVL